MKESSPSEESERLVECVVALREPSHKPNKEPLCGFICYWVGISSDPLERSGGKKKVWVKAARLSKTGQASKH